MSFFYEWKDIGMMLIYNLIWFDMILIELISFVKYEYIWHITGIGILNKQRQKKKRCKINETELARLTAGDGKLFGGIPPTPGCSTIVSVSSGIYVGALGAGSPLSRFHITVAVVMLLTAPCETTRVKTKIHKWMNITERNY